MYLMDYRGGGWCVFDRLLEGHWQHTEAKTLFACLCTPAIDIKTGTFCRYSLMLVVIANNLRTNC